jgi:hypothetical protein
MTFSVRLPASTRMGLFLTVWALGLVWLTLARVHAEKGPPPVSTEALDWSAVARGNDREARYRAIGKLVKRLRRNMTRHQVEKIIGLPDQDVTKDSIIDGVGCAVYLYEPAEGEPVALLWMLYDVRSYPMRVVEIKERVPLL